MTAEGNDLEFTSRKLAIALGLLFFIGVFAALNSYMLFIKDTSKSYSLTQKWSEYYNLENWNSSASVFEDLDDDGHEDKISFTGCATLSTVNIEVIPEDQRCEDWVFQKQVDAGQNFAETTGQMLSKSESRFPWILQSFFVKTNKGTYRYYEYVSLGKVYVMEMKNNGVFVEVEPTLKDKIDAAFFQVSHVAIMPMIFVL